jgi:hypothetical protein
MCAKCTFPPDRLPAPLTARISMDMLWSMFPGGPFLDLETFYSLSGLQM